MLETVFDTTRAVVVLVLNGTIARRSAPTVASIADMRALAKGAVDAFGAIDVMVNNAGIMPLAFFSDHAQAIDAWHRCLDVNMKGVLNGMVAVYDQMMAQGRGHIVNLSSIYGNFPVVAPEFIADAIVYAIDQPWGVSIGDVTVRAAGDHFIL